MLNIRSTAEWGSTLRSCAMTCRAWFPRSRRHLFRCLSIHSKPSLLRLAAVLPTSDSPPSCHVSSLEGLEPESPQERPWLNRFGHLLPYYLKEKLPHASQLVLHDNSQAGYSDRGLRIYHPSFFPLLAHFHNVEDLTLRGYWFLYFDDLRRLLGALENLKRATLIDSGWKVRSSYVPPKPLFHATQWKLSQLNLEGCYSPHMGVYIWLLPPLCATSRSYRGADHESAHPCLSSGDVATISDVLKELELSTWDSWSLRFQCFSQLGSCEFIFACLSQMIH